MDVRDFLTLAQRDVAGSTEAEWRTGVSRAYYAVFHVARQLFRDLGFVVPRAEQAHRYLWLRLSNCGDNGGEQAGQDLDILRRDRNRADYDVDQVFRQDEAMRSSVRAEQLLQTLDTLRLQPTRTQITDAMKVYERDVLKDVTWRP